MLPHRLQRRQILRPHPGGLQQLQVFRAVDRHRSASAATGIPSLAGEALMGLEERLGECVHHHAAVFAIGDLGHDCRHRGISQWLPAQPEGLVAGLLHLSVLTLHSDATR